MQVIKNFIYLVGFHVLTTAIMKLRAFGKLHHAVS
jgi:hypothetical protein